MARGHGGVVGGLFLGGSSTNWGGRRTLEWPLDGSHPRLCMASVSIFEKAMPVRRGLNRSTVRAREGHKCRSPEDERQRLVDSGIMPRERHNIESSIMGKWPIKVR
ncbi:hypothetical protein N658DRAFT_124056 [Parathielavia hyrcaniae]|uniref:Uncharacterized protein n=1 Tax=Parathielavia hyrcaniae TaxID=113614 RepID=A0AAN6Q8J0_9PEZI|nr:hypothetical protein N658DRAFT_124056 [Parathielavia hyrcaniae]